MHRFVVILIAWVMLPLAACRSGGIEINVRYDQISSLTVERRVVFQGNGVGAVESIEYTRDGNYVVELHISKKFAHTLTENAQFFIVDDPDSSGVKAVEIRHLKNGDRLLSDGATVAGAHDTKALSRKLQKDIESGLKVVKQAFEEIGRDIQKIPESEEYRDLKRSLDALAREMVQKEKAVRETIKRQWLPRIQRELDGLRERLKQLGRDEEMAPLDEQVERLRRI